MSDVLRLWQAKNISAHLCQTGHSLAVWGVSKLVLNGCGRVREGAVACTAPPALGTACRLHAQQLRPRAWPETSEAPRGQGCTWTVL